MCPKLHWVSNFPVKPKTMPKIAKSQNIICYTFDKSSDVRLHHHKHVCTNVWCMLCCHPFSWFRVSHLPFGWNILEMNRTEGGLLGYSSVNSIVSLNVPSSKGVSWGLKHNTHDILLSLTVFVLCTSVDRNYAIFKWIWWVQGVHQCSTQKELCRKCYMLEMMFFPPSLCHICKQCNIFIADSNT